MNINRSSMAQVSFQGIGKSPLPSFLTCHPCIRSKLLPMSPVCTHEDSSEPSPPPPPPRKRGREQTESAARADHISPERALAASNRSADAPEEDRVGPPGSAHRLDHGRIIA